MAAPEREVYVMVGDGSYLMLSGEIVTSIQEGLKLALVLSDNHGFSSIGGLSRSLGTDGFGTQYRYRHNRSLGLDSDSSPAPLLPVDLAANAESLGAKVIRCRTIDDLRLGLEAAKGEDSTVVLAIEVDRYEGVPEYESWWDVPVAEVSEVDAVQAAREAYSRARAALSCVGQKPRESGAFARGRTRGTRGSGSRFSHAGRIHASNGSSAAAIERRSPARPLR